VRGTTRCRGEDQYAGPQARVGDADIWHAVRTAIRKIDMDDDLTMLIGPARDGAPLEIGVLDLNGEDPVVIHAFMRCGCVQSFTRLSGKGDVMKHTDAQIEDAARLFERLADSLDPASVAPEDLSDLRAVAEAAEQVRRDVSGLGPVDSCAGDGGVGVPPWSLTTERQLWPRWSGTWSTAHDVSPEVLDKFRRTGSHYSRDRY
jgi:hypothetical protein